MNAYIQTLNGPYFFHDPKRNIHALGIPCISKGLSQINRFGGQTIRPYSVAAHSVTVANLVFEKTGDPKKALAGLLHDAPEVFLGDIPTPLKNLLGDTYKSLESKSLAAILDHYDLPAELPPEVRSADLIALATEARDLTRPDPTPWPILEGITPLDTPTPDLTSTEAEELFLDKFNSLAVEIEIAANFE